jgi:hypothetical protein
MKFNPKGVPQMSKETRLNLLKRQPFLQQRVVEKRALSYGKIIGRAPVGMYGLHLFFENHLRLDFLFSLSRFTFS